MSDTRLDLAIIIVSWNVQKLLHNCLESLFSDLMSSGLAGDVWVVDNASADESVDMVRRSFPRAHLLALEENVGFARANNAALRELIPGLGAEAIRSDEGSGPAYVMLLNPDTTVEPGALRTLASCLDTHPSAGVVGPQLRYPDGSFQHAAFRFPSLAQIFFDFFPLHYRLINSAVNGRYPRALYSSGEAFEIDHPLGAAMMVRRQAIAEVGGLDDGFFMYCEEIDWCWRMRQAGWKAYCVPQAAVVHHEAQSTRQRSGEMSLQLWRSRYRLFRKHYSRAFRWAARRLVWLGTRKQLASARRARDSERLTDQAYGERVETLRQIRRLQ